MRIDISNVRLSNGLNSNVTNEKSKDENSASLKFGIRAQKAKKDDARLKLISNLEKIRDEYKEEKGKIMQMNLPPDEKKAKIKDITDKINETEGQIQEIKAQIQQEKIEEEKKKLEEKKAEQEKKEQENSNGDIKKDGVIISKSLSNLIKMNSSTRDIHNLKSIMYRQKLEASYIKPNMNENSYDSKRLKQIAISNARIDGAVNRKIGELVDISSDKNRSNHHNVNMKKNIENKDHKESINEKNENDNVNNDKKLE